MNNVLEVKFFKGWQSPAMTEKQAWLNHCAYSQHVDARHLATGKHLYVGAPWASVLDYIAKRFGKISTDGPKKKLLDLALGLLEPYLASIGGVELHTVCQHIYWKNLIPVWEAFNFKHVYCSHLTADYPQCSSQVQFHPWPLYAVNAENPQRMEGLIFKPWMTKRYLCSFVGCVDNEYYRSDIRLQLRRVMTQPQARTSFFSENETWFFRQEVFGTVCGQGIPPAVKTYNQILSDSVFSLCPEGSGPNTIRLWESLAVGSIPVLFANDWVPPELDGLAWEDISITVQPDEVPRLFDILNEVPKSRILQMQLNCLNAYQRFRNRLVPAFKPITPDLEAHYIPRKVFKQAKLDLVTYTTASHEELQDEFLLNSKIEDFNLVQYRGEQKCPTGNYRDSGWYACVTDKLSSIIHYMQTTQNEFFVYSDADVVFLQNNCDYLLTAIQQSNKDVLFVDDFEGGYCTGFFVAKISDKLIAFYQKVRDFILYAEQGDQNCLNMLCGRLFETFPERASEISSKFSDGYRFDLNFGCLPNQEFVSYRSFANTQVFWKPGDTLPAIDSSVRLFHANWTFCLANKKLLLQHALSYAIR